MKKPTDKERTAPPFSLDGTDGPELKRNSFRVPEGYFEGLTPRVMQRVRDAAPAEDRGINWQALFSRRVLIPAFSIALLMTVWVYSSHRKNDATPDFKALAASMSLEDMDDFADFDSEELAEADRIDYDRADADLTVLEGLDRADVLDYLLDEDAEMNTIVEQINI